MKELYFTIGLEYEEVLALPISGSIIYNIGQLFDVFQESIGPHGYNKIDLLTKFFNQKSDSTKGIIIQAGFENKNDYQNFKESINQPINKVYIKYSNTVDEYMEKWEKLSNWADTVETYISREQSWNKEIKELVKVLAADGVEVEFIE